MLGPLGAGGMAAVFAVHDRNLRRTVALKVLHEGSSAEAQRRFVDEAQVMGQLQHPGILPVHELGQAGAGKPYYTMPLVRGQSLRSLLDALGQGDEAARRGYSPTRLVQVFLQVAQAVGYAHDRGVLHRDLKPANIMLGEHGEVQVIDWGLSKVIVGRAVATDLDADLTHQGQAVGTPAYMSPEQARGEELDERSDVHALGAILYEILTGERAFTGRTGEVMTKVMRELPVPPRERAPGRSIPLELEQACLRALAKRREDRHPTVAALQAEVQRWLDAETDRGQRHERAEELARAGAALLEEYRRLKQEASRLEQAAVETAKRFAPWQPAEEKSELTRAQDRARAARRHLVEAGADAVGALEKALGFEAGNETARRCLAGYYRDRFLDAEAAGSEGEAEFFRRRVAAYHDGRYARELAGDGSLELASEPPGAELWIHRFVERGFLLVAEAATLLGCTPLAPTPLPMGSYLVVPRKEGFPETRYPVCITRNRNWAGQVRLATGDERGEGFVLIPAGPFVRGGDPGAWNPLPRCEPWVEDFFLAEHPVTMAEYLEYLDELAQREGLAAARARSPRYKYDQPGSSYLVEEDGARLRLPDVDAEGDRWEARMPVLSISAHDAEAYCAWRSARDGRRYRLPSEEEWEKAARGVDGRWFPWGWRFDPSLCNMRDSRPERDGPVVVDRFPHDVSVYGVRGLAGNVRNWTATEVLTGSGSGRRIERSLRGCGWDSAAHGARSCSRAQRAPTAVNVDIGFRLARSR